VVRFQPNYRWPLATKILMGPKKVSEWNDGTDNLYHHAKFGENRTTHVGVRGWSDFSFCFFYLPAGSAADSSVGIVFTNVPVFGFFAPQGRHAAPIKVKFDREDRVPLLPAKFHLDRLRGGGLRLTPEKWHFTNIITPKGRVPCTIFTKFTGYMSLGEIWLLYISINDKIIKNLLRWGVFGQIFDDPAKLLMGPKTFWAKWWHGPPLSSCRIWWKSNDARRRDREEEVWCFSLFLFWK